MLDEATKVLRVDTLIAQIRSHNISAEANGVIDCNGWGLNDVDATRIISALTTTVPLQTVFRIDFSNNNLTCFKLNYAGDDTNNLSELCLDNNPLKDIELKGATFSFSKLSLQNVDQGLVDTTIKRYVGYEAILSSSDLDKNVFSIGDPDVADILDGLELDNITPEALDLKALESEIESGNFWLPHTKSQEQTCTIEDAQYAEALENGVDMRLWYSDQIINTVTKGLLDSLGLKLSATTNGIVLNTEASDLYRNKLNISMSFCPVIATGVTAIEQQARISVLADCLTEIIERDDVCEHTILIPVNLNGIHWCLAVLSLHKINKQIHALDLEVFDSLFRTFPEELNLIISSATSKYLAPGAKLVLKISTDTKLQNDTSSCGPIVVDRISDLLTNGRIEAAGNQNTHYSSDDVFAIRAFHLNLPHNEYLRDLQGKDMPNIELRQPEIISTNTQLEIQLCEGLSKLSATDKNVFVKTAASFLQFQKSLQTATPCTNTTIMQQIKHVLNGYSALKEFATNIFDYDASDNSYLWKSDGIDTLVQVLDAVLYKEYLAIAEAKSINSSIPKIMTPKATMLTSYESTPLEPLDLNASELPDGNIRHTKSSEPKRVRATQFDFS